MNKKELFIKTMKFSLCTLFFYMPLAVAAQNVQINETNFPDENFRNHILLSYDVNKDSMLTKEEIKSVTGIYVDSKRIGSLKGIEHFTSLKSLSCHSNSITSLDVSKNTALTSLNCYYNSLTVLDISKNTALTSVVCGHNQLAALDVSKNVALTVLNCKENKLTSLDLSKNIALQRLYCYTNLLTTLDVSKNKALEFLECYGNQIKGESMDALISALPQNTTTQTYEFRVYYPGRTNNNVCTKSQVAATKAKGWTPLYYDASTKLWVEYEGSDDEVAGITLPELETENSNAPVYNLAGQKVTSPVKDGIYIVGGKKVVVK